MSHPMWLCPLPKGTTNHGMGAATPGRVVLGPELSGLQFTGFYPGKTLPLGTLVQLGRL